MLVAVVFKRVPAAYLYRDNVDLITASHEIFWMSPFPKLEIFFADLENIISRLKQDSDGRFTRYVPFRGDDLAGGVTRSINSLTMEKIAQILEEGNERVIEVILEKGFKYAFTKWNSIDLRRLPQALLASFPIEFLPQTAFDTLNMSQITDCILARAEMDRFKNFQELIPKLGRVFWGLPEVRRSKELRTLLDAFHMESYENYRFNNAVDEVSVSNRVEDMYSAPYCFMLDLLINSEEEKILSNPELINPATYQAIYNQLSVYFYTLQTFLHEFTIGNIKNIILIEIIIEASARIQRVIKDRMVSRVGEVGSLNELIGIFKRNYSSEVNPKDFVGFFAEGQNVEISFLRLESLTPDAILSQFLMSAKDGRSRAEVAAFHDHIATEFLSHRNALKPFEHNYKLLCAFGRCLNRNRRATNQVYSSFRRSPWASRGAINFVAQILAANNGNLTAMLMDRGLDGESNQLKFTTIFSGTFVDDADVVSDTTDRFNRHTGMAVSSVISKQSYSIRLPPTFKKFGSRIPRKAADIGKKRRVDELSSDSDTTGYHKLQRTDARWPGALVSVRPLRLANSAKTFKVSDTSSTLAEQSDEYCYVNYLFAAEQSAELDALEEENSKFTYLKEPLAVKRSSIVRKVTEDPIERPVELKFMNEMIVVLSETMKYPACKPTIVIEGSRVTGDGIFTDSLASFGRLISLPRLKTVEFREEVDGFVPLPLLCPKIMSVLGSLMALSLKHEVPLSWSFAPIFRKFLFSDDAECIEFIIEIVYKDLFDSVKYRFESGTKDQIELLPRIFCSHRMFELPGSGISRPAPFLFENRFLQILDESKRADHLSDTLLNCEFYLQVLKLSIKRHLLEGRIEFQRGFRVYFKESVRPFLKHENIDEFIRGHKADAEEISNALLFNGGGSDLQVVDDFFGSSGNVLISPFELMKRIISALSQEQLDQFLWFVTGSSGTILNGFESQKIGFNVVEAVSNYMFCKSQVCFKSFTLVLHERSAKATFDKFLESISNSRGFALYESST